jgi:hypothetical protein
MIRIYPPITPEIYRFNHLNFQPRVGLFVTDELVVAAQGMFASTWATDQVLHSFYGWGVLSRYYPQWIRQTIHQWFGKDWKGLFFCVQPFFEGGYHRASYYQSSPSNQYTGTGGVNTLVTRYFTTGNPSIDEFQVAAGLDLRLYRSIYLELSLVYVYRPDPRFPAPAALQKRIGIDVLLNPKHHE